MSAPTPIAERLRQLREARGWSRDRLSREAFAIDPVGTGSQQIASIELRRRPASARTMLALAEALGVEPTEFAEYRLALARHVLDEERVGLEAALFALESSGIEPVSLDRQEIETRSRRRRPEPPEPPAS